MKFPKFVRKKNANKINKTNQRPTHQWSHSHCTPKLGSSLSLPKSHPVASAVVTSASPRTPSSQQHDLSRSTSSRQSSAASSVDDYDYSSGSSDASYYSQSSASSLSRSSSHRSSTRSSSASTRSHSRIAAAPTTSPRHRSTEAALRMPRTQYSAYARKMMMAKRHRNMLAHTNSAVNFDGADAFFDKSDSSLGTGGSPSFTPAIDGPRRSRSDSCDTNYDDEDGEDDDDEDEEVEVAVARRPYHSTVPTGRRMTEKELMQRRLLREMEENAVAARQAKLQKQASARERKTYIITDAAAAASTPCAAGAAEIPMKAAKGNATATAAASTSNNHGAENKRKDASPLTATSAIAPVQGGRESRHNRGKTKTSGASNSKRNNQSGSGKSSSSSMSGKKPGGLFGWRLRLRSSSRKSCFAAGKDDVSSVATPSRRNGSVTLPSTSPPMSSVRATSTTERCHNSSSGVAGLPPISPNAKAEAHKATTRSVFSNAAAQLVVSTALLLDSPQAISTETLHNLDGKQLGGMNYNSQKARKASLPKPISPSKAGRLSANPSPSLISTGGYGSFIFPFSASRDGDEYRDRNTKKKEVADDARSNGSRVSYRSSRSVRSQCSNNSIRSRSSSHSQSSSNSSSNSSKHHHEKLQQGMAASPPKSGSRSGNFFRTLFHNSSGDTKNGSGSSKKHAQADKSEIKRRRPITADTGTLRKTTEASQADRQSSSQQQQQQQHQMSFMGSPSSDPSGVGAISLYCIENDLSNTSTDSSHGAKSNRTDQLMRQRCTNLPASDRRSTLATVSATTRAAASCSSFAQAPPDNPNGSFESLFKGGGASTAPALPAVATLYGSPEPTPSDFSRTPTFGLNDTSTETLMPLVSQRSGMGIAGAARMSPSMSLFSPPTRQQQQQHAFSSVPHPVGLFPYNFRPRAVDGDGALAAQAADAAATSTSNSINAVNPAAGVGAVSGAAVGAAQASAAAAVAASSTVASSHAGMNSDANTRGAAGTATTAEAAAAQTVIPATANADVLAEELHSNSLSPLPLFDVVTSSAAQPAILSMSLSSGDELKEQKSFSRLTRRQHRHHRNHNDQQQQQQHTPSPSSATPKNSVHGGHSSRVKRSGVDDKLTKAAKESNGSSGSSSSAKVAYPPPRVPSPSDPRRSDNPRLGGGSGGRPMSVSSATAASAATGETSHEQSKSAVALKLTDKNSTSLPPQPPPPVLSSTESRNYRGRGGNGVGGTSNGNSSGNSITSSSGAAGGGAGNPFNAAAIASRQGSEGTLPTALPTRADSRDFLLRRNPNGTTTTAATTATAATPRQSSHESSRSHRHGSGKRSHSSTHQSRRSSNTSSRYEGSFSFSSESLLDGKARGWLAKAAAASSAERRLAQSNRNPRHSNTASGASEDDAGEAGSGTRHHRHHRQQQLLLRDHSPVSSRGSHHFWQSETSPQYQHAPHDPASPGPSSPCQHRVNEVSQHNGSTDSDRGEVDSLHQRHRNGLRRSLDTDPYTSSGSLRRRRNRHDMHGLNQRPSSSSVSLVTGLDEVVGHKAMQPRKASASTVSSAGNASSSRNSSVSSGGGGGGDLLDEAVGRNSVRALRKMAAKARDASNNSLCELDGGGNNKLENGSGGDNHNTFHAHTKAMPPIPDRNFSAALYHNNNSNGSNASINNVLAASGPQLTHAHHSGSAPSSAPVLHFSGMAPGGNGNATLITSNPIGGTYAMKLPSFRPDLVVESSSSSNDVSTDRPANSNGPRQQQQQQQQNLQRTPLTMSHEEGSANPFNSSNNHLLQLARLQGSRSNGDCGTSPGERDTDKNNNSGSGVDRVMSSVEYRKTTGGVYHPANVGVGLSPARGQHSLGSNSSVVSGSEANTCPFFSESGLRTSVSSALLAQPRDTSAKRRRPATESFTPWSVDMSRFNKLREAQNASSAAQ